MLLSPSIKEHTLTYVPQINDQSIWWLPSGRFFDLYYCILLPNTNEKPRFIQIDIDLTFLFAYSKVTSTEERKTGDERRPKFLATRVNMAAILNVPAIF